VINWRCRGNLLTLSAASGDLTSSTIITVTPSWAKDTTTLVQSPTSTAISSTPNTNLEIPTASSTTNETLQIPPSATLIPALIIPSASAAVQYTVSTFQARRFARGQQTETPLPGSSQISTDGAISSQIASIIGVAPLAKTLINTAVVATRKETIPLDSNTLA